MGQFWSLCVEEQFYLIWPWVMYLVRSRRKLMAICAGAVFLMPLLRGFVQSYGPPWVTQGVIVSWVGVPFQLDSLLLGALIAFLWRGQYRSILEQVAKRVASLATLALVLAVIYISHFHFSNLMAKPYAPWQGTWGLSIVNLYSAAIMVTALQPGTWVYQLMHLRPLRSLGLVTYGAYLFHDMPHLLLAVWLSRLGGRLHIAVLSNDWTITLVALVLTFGFAFFSFHFFEVSFLRLKERFAPQQR